MARLDFDPETIEEVPDLSDVGDDDVDTSGTRTQGDLVVNRGDVVVWRHLYTKGGPGYKVMNNDPADIESLQLFGVGKDATVDVTLSLLIDGGASHVVALGEHTWAANNLLVSSENDRLGNLQGKCICGFEIEIRFVRGRNPTTLKKIDFFWEVDDIETCTCDG